MAKSLAFIHRNDTRFSVGDFYPVLSVFSYHELGGTTSPFLLLDHLGPGQLTPKSKRKGVNQHPHRGFETVTIMFKGELEHEDTTGEGGIISAGDVQWMTAASGVLHKEQFSEAFREQGGDFEMIQLWVNLPAQDKMNFPRYQGLLDAEIPKIILEDGQGYLRIIAGEYQQQQGPAQTHTPINMFDVRLQAGQTLTLPAQVKDTTLIYLRTGQLNVDATAEELVNPQDLAVMSSLDQDVEIKALKDSHFLFLNGQPIYEPINGHGPFVMNTYDEILQAYDDIKSDRFIKERSE